METGCQPGKGKETRPWLEKVGTGETNTVVIDRVVLVDGNRTSTEITCAGV